MAWLSLVICAPQDAVESLSDTLTQQGALAVTIEDSLANRADEQAIFDQHADEPRWWQHNTISALFDEHVQLGKVLSALGEPFCALSHSVSLISECDWVNASQADYPPIKISDTLWIVPSWHAVPDAQATCVRLDPGLAFGTGSHPTTHLCLSWLEEVVTPTVRVLDYGCGSGILAITAKKLGAYEAVGVDNDEQALMASRDNAKNNHVSAVFQHVDNLGDNFSPFDIVVANILSNTLKVLAIRLAKSCAPRGKIALSGILQTQVEEVATYYTPWFDMHPPQIRDGWALLTGTKRGL